MIPLFETIVSVSVFTDAYKKLEKIELPGWLIIGFYLLAFAAFIAWVVLATRKPKDAFTQGMKRGINKSKK